MKLVRRYVHWLHGRWPAGHVEALPITDEDGRTNVPGLFVVGDLRGVPLLKLSADTGARAAAAVATELGAGTDRKIGTGGGVAADATEGRADAGAEVRDLAIIGAGVAGMAAALEASRVGLDFVLLEAAEPFSTVVNFPKGKPIFTYPKGMEPAGELAITAEVKEELVDELRRQTAAIEPRIARAEGISRQDGLLQVRLAGGEVIRARRVIAALGRSGNHRKLGVPGESADHVMNRLHDPRDYCDRRVLVVGGGDSAVETAVALAMCGAEVTLCHRGKELARPKPDNLERLEAMRRGPCADDATVAVSEPTSERVTTAAGEFLEGGQRRGGVRLLVDCRVREIRDGEVTVETGGTAETLPNDVIFTMIGREAPLEFFRRSGVTIHGERSGRFWASLAAFVAAIAFLYHWKAGGKLTALFESRDWFPFGLPAPADPSTLIGTLAVSFGTPAAWFSAVYTLAIVAFGVRRIRRRRTPYITAQTSALMLIQVVPLFVLPIVALPWAGNAGLFGDRHVVATLAPETVAGWFALETAEDVSPRGLAERADKAGLLPAGVRDWPDLSAEISWSHRVDGDRVILRAGRDGDRGADVTDAAAGTASVPVREAVLRLSDARVHVRDDSRPTSAWVDSLFPASEWDPHGREYWRAFGLILAWPLFLWNVFTSAPMGAWLVISLLQTFVAIPILVYSLGKGAYCGWICSCGALAETLGDAHRHKMPHGPGANRWNLLGQWILLFALVLLGMRVAAWFLPWEHPLHALFSGAFVGKTLSGATLPFPLSYLNYKWFVDLFLAGIVGTGFYFHFSGRVWCRFACPLAALMHIYARFSRFRILADKKKCISCNVCTSVCHQGIDVMNFANKGVPMADPQCVRCSACVQSCPTGVLAFGRIDPRSGAVTSVDRLAASPVRIREGDKERRE